MDEYILANRSGTLNLIIHSFFDKSLSVDNKLLWKVRQSLIDLIHEFQDTLLEKSWYVKCCSYSIPPTPQVRGVYKPEKID